MRRNAFAVAVIFAALITPLLAGFVQGQTETPRVEIGVHYSRLSLDDVDLLYGESRDNGYGGRITVNPSRWFAFEAEFDYFKRGAFPGNRTLGLFGGKFGFRGERAGIFAKVRPGFLRFGVPDLPGPSLPGRCAGVQEYNPAIDVGGVLEFYPANHLVVRFDGGDTIVRITRRCPFPGDHEFIKHNLQFNTGIGLRF